MSGTKWADSGAASYATIGEDLDGVSWSLFARDSSASVVVHDQHGDDHTLVERRASSRDDAKTVAEQALREMHDALSAHFAPVLRWSDNRAELLGCWELSVGEQPDGLWWWTTMLGGDFGEDGGDCTTAANARRAAETSLRGFGVVFRVEGE